MLREPSPRQFLAIGTSLVTYLGLGIVLWQLADDVRIKVLLESTYLLAIGLLLLIHQYQRLRERNGQLQASYDEAGRISDELERAKMLSEGMLSVILILSEQPKNDDQHHFSYIREEYVIHGDDGSYNWILHGKNALSTPSSELVIKLAGDSPVDSKTLFLAVTDELTDQPLDVRLRADHAFCKIVAIEFPIPLQRDEEFQLKMNCRWNNTFVRSRQYDYVFSAWGAYATQGIDRLVGRVVSDVPLSQFLLERLEGEGHRIKDRVQPKQVETSQQRNALEWEITDARHVFLLTFRKDIPS